MMNKYTYSTLTLVLVILSCATSRGENKPVEQKKHYNQLLFGYGTSYPGWGETTERVQTADIVLRHARVFKTREEGLLKGNHEFWIEAPFSIILSDSDHNDRNDIGIIGLNFLFAWVFPETRIGSPYIMAGGGPVYVLADIEGVGSDLCGNYQMGGGIRLNIFGDTPVNLEARYHHISNLGAEEPNIALNSTKFLFGFTLPF